MADTNNIREIREQRGIYQDDLAAAIGSVSYTHLIETSGNSKKSRIYFYNQNLEKTATLPLEYASLGLSLIHIFVVSASEYL